MSARTRRVVRALAVFAVVFVVLALAASLVLRLWGAARYREAAARFEREAGSLDPASHAPPNVPERDNAVTWLRRGTAAAIMNDDERGLVNRCAQGGPAVWTGEDEGRYRDIRIRNAPALQLLERGVPLPRSTWGIDYARGTGAKLPNLLDGLNAAKLLACDGRLAVRDLDFDRAVRRAEMLGRLARSYQDENVLIVFLIGIAVERMQLVLARDVATAPAVPSEVFGSLRAAIGDVPLRRRLVRVLDADAAATIRSIGRPSDRFDGTERGFWGHRPQRAAWTIVSGFWGAEYLDATLELRSVFESVPTLGSSERGGFEGRDWSLWERSVRSGMLPLGNTIDRAASTECLRRLVERALELRLAGPYPAILAPPSTAEDDPFSGEPFTWTVRPDGSAELAAPTTAKEAAKVVLASEEAWWRFELPSPTPPSGSSSSSPTTPGRPGTSPSPRPPARTPPS